MVQACARHRYNGRKPSDAAAGEHYEWTSMYAEMAKTAREEGFTEIAFQMEATLPRLKKSMRKDIWTLAQNIKDGKVFEKEQMSLAVCELRTYLLGKESSRNLPGLQTSESVFPGQTGKNYK